MDPALTDQMGASERGRFEKPNQRSDHIHVRRVLDP